MLKLFLWLKYLRKRKIVLLSVATVALSVALLIVVASLFTGFIAAFENSAVEIIGDVVLSAPKPFTDYDELIELLVGTGSAEAATPIISGQGLLHLGPGHVRAVSVWGVEPAGRTKVTTYQNSLLRQKDPSTAPSFAVEGQPEAVGGFVGIAVISEPDEQTDEYDMEKVELAIKTQQRAVLTTGTVLKDNSGSPGSVKFKRRVVPFNITDVMFTGVYDLDKRFIYLPKDQLQKALYPDQTRPVADQIQIKLPEGADPELAIAKIRGVWQVFAESKLDWGPYTISATDIESSRGMQGQYVFELRKQMGVLLFIFGVVDFTVILLISCIFYLIVRLKRKDIGIIKSCGAGGWSVATIFLGFGLVVGAVGAGIGTLLGYAVTRNINTIEHWITVVFGLKLWKSSVYMFSRIPNDVDWPAVGNIVILSILAAGIGAVVPAIVAARTKPVEILQYE